MLARQGDEAAHIGRARDRTLRIGGRSEVEGDRARQQVFAQRVEVGQEARLRPRREVDRLAVGRDRAGRIDRIERIGDQHCGPASARLYKSLGGDRREEEPLARAAEHEHLACGIDFARQFVAAVEPRGRGGAEALGPLVGRIAAEIIQMRLQHRADEGRNRMLRLADGEADRGLARRRIGEQFGKAHEWRALVDGARRRKRHGVGRAHEWLLCKTGSPHGKTIGGVRLRRD